MLLSVAISRVRGKKGKESMKMGVRKKKKKNVHAKTGRKEGRKKKTNKYSECNINMGLK